jgi:general secretion pathway protein F/type IV pilus assembly protein PilC
MILGHRRLSLWYDQLAQQLEAGLPLADAVRLSQGNGASASTLEAMALAIEQGGSVDDALRCAGSWLPFADRLALTASASAGRMPRTLRALAARHAQIGAAKLRVVLACAYPLGILHFGLLLLPVTRMIDWEKGFQWSASAYARGVALTILPLWIAGLVIWILARQAPALIGSVGRFVPAVRNYMRSQALSDFSFVLGNLLEAGIPIGPAWAAVGTISSSPKLRSAAVAVEKLIARGEAPGAKLATWSCFPADFIVLYRTGESTGQLDTNLLRLAAIHQEAANRALAFATLLYPALMFSVVAGAVAYLVI